MASSLSERESLLVCVQWLNAAPGAVILFGGMTKDFAMTAVLPPYEDIVAS